VFRVSTAAPPFGVNAHFLSTFCPVTPVLTSFLPVFPA
jgi:hypothetical protein